MRNADLRNRGWRARAGRRARLVALAAFFVLAGCATVPIPSDAKRIFDAKPLIHEEWYKRLYREVQECVGKRGAPFAEIEWYVVPKGSMGTSAGLWSWPARIYLDEQYVLHQGVIKHELIHFVGQGQPPLHHGGEVFERCAGVA